MTVVSLSDRGTGGKPTGGSRPSYFAALDIGSTKICCLIAKTVSPRKTALGGISSRIQVLGIGYQVAHGIRAGAVTDMDAAERAIRAAVDAAERMANVTIDAIFVNVSGGRPFCHRNNAEVRLAGRAINAHDINRVLHGARSGIDAGGRTVVHATPVGYTLDGNSGISDPEGMFGDVLGVDLNVITVEPGPMRNLALCIERCHLGVNSFVLAPLASGLSSLVEDEKDLGVICIDLGGGTTNVAIFYEGRLIFGDVIPVGGHHITTDIARGLSTPVAHAERIKALFGSGLPSATDDRELITVPVVGERGTDTVNKIPKSMLTGIIQPRIEETLELVRDRIKGSGLEHLAGRRVVLTGGASQMTGMDALATTILDRQVRMGAPSTGMIALPEAARGPAFSVVTGLLEYAADPQIQLSVASGPGQAIQHDAGYFARVGQWIKESF